MFLPAKFQKLSDESIGEFSRQSYQLRSFGPAGRSSKVLIKVCGHNPPAPVGAVEQRRQVEIFKKMFFFQLLVRVNFNKIFCIQHFIFRIFSAGLNLFPRGIIDFCALFNIFFF